jgi:uncharacterized protein HemY
MKRLLQLKMEQARGPIPSSCSWRRRRRKMTRRRKRKQQQQQLAAALFKLNTGNFI